MLVKKNQNQNQNDKTRKYKKIKIAHNSTPGESLVFGA